MRSKPPSTCELPVPFCVVVHSARPIALPSPPYCVQWEALFLLVAGITINQLRNCPSTGVVEAAVPIVTAGLCVLGSVTVPSAASVRKEEGGGRGLWLEECSKHLLHGCMAQGHAVVRPCSYFPTPYALL